MANRFIGGVLSSQQPSSGGFVSRASTGTYFNNTGTLVTAPINQPRLNYSFNGNPITTRYSGQFNITNFISVPQTTATDLGSANFTIEMWIYFTGQNTTGASNNNICGKWNGTSQWILQFRAAGLDSVTNQHWRFYFNSSVGTDFQEASTTAVQLNTWYHIALVRNGSNFIFYRNGVQVGSTYTNAATITATSDYLSIGNAQTAVYGVTGYISNFRLVTGTAVYTGTYTVPTGPLTATQSANPFGGSNTAAIASGTQVLTLQNVGFTDNSSNNFALVNNSVVPSTFLPPIYTSDFSGTGWYNPAVLIEPPATNLIQYSTAYTNGFWTPYNNSGAILTVTANTAIAPDGTQTASTITGSATAGFKVIGPGAVTSWISVNGAYTYSFFVKAGTASYVTTWAGGAAAPAGSDFAVYNLATGALTSSSMGTNSSTSIINVGNGWWRVIWTSTYNSSNSSSPIIGLADPSVTTRAGATSSTGTLYIWGSQFEQGSTATSYIPTSGATVTRSQDNVGPLGSGIYTLAALENQTSIDDQATVQSFTATGSSTWTCPVDVTSVEVLVVAGGGGANSSSGGNSTGGGGGGGVVYNTSYSVVPGTTYPIIVGAGGAPAASNSFNPLNGGNSQFGNLIAIGGGFGGARDPNTTGGSGGSGGGGNTYGTTGGQGIAGQGFPGGTGLNYVASTSGGGGGGGGAAGPGGNAVGRSGGVNGPGIGLTISGSLVYYGAGGVGQNTGGADPTAVAGGTAPNTNGAANTGAGGAGGTVANGTSTGGSGIVVVKYKRTQSRLTATSNAAIVTQKFTTTLSSGWTAPVGVTSVEVLVVGGGGGGGYGTSGRSGGGGAGGVVYNSAFTVTPGNSYTVTIGNGGAGSTTNAQLASVCNGSNSVFGTLTALGGGGGGNAGTDTSANVVGANGGSGGGGGGSASITNNYVGGTATQPGSGSGGFGNAGGTGVHLYGTWAGGGSGGGAGGAGNIALNISGYAAPGGAGLPYSIIGNTEYYAGGGGGNYYTGTAFGPGGVGGGGIGNSTGAGFNAAPNSGGGGGAGGNGAGGNGGSGVVILRYRVPTIATFLDSGTWTCPAGVTSVQALIVGGGGSGSGSRGASNGSPGGGAGGVVYSSSVKVTPGVTYPVIVGQGGIGISATDGYPGQNSSFAGIVAYGGGGGNGASSFDANRFSGGSGGGAGESYTNGQGVYGQGNAGGTNTAAGAGTNAGAGGGGAGGAGTSIALNVHVGGTGGPGLAFSISGTSTYYGGGGGGTCDASSSTYGTGGVGGGGNATVGTYTTRAGTPNTGGGGGGAFNGVSADGIGGFGGSGIVIIRYYGG